MDGSCSQKIPLGAIKYMIHHVFLPPKLPQQDDFNQQYETILLESTSDALQKFEAAGVDGLKGIINMIGSLQNALDESGAISEWKLESALRRLSTEGGVIPLYIRAQNAGVIISKVNGEICFEACELSPRNDSVITTKGRLRRSFPGSAFVVSQTIFDKDGFQATLAKTIAKMSHQIAPDMQPKVWKAGQEHNENRDTTYPHLVTEHLMSFIRAVGKPATVSTIWKNTREEVMWLDCERPWRRSQMWLLVRVALQLGFSRSDVPTKSPKDLYKAFMTFSMANILELCRTHTLSSDTLYVMNAKVSQRLLKLGAVQASPWIDMVNRVISSTHDRINTRWQEIIDKTDRRLDMLSLKSLKFKDDLDTHLPDLDSFLATVTRRQWTPSTLAFESDSRLPRYSPDDLPSSLDACTEDYQSFNLAAFESWVASCLPRWDDLHVSDLTTCERLRELIASYYTSAAPRYANNPERSSIMLLTVMELWVACDESACSIYDLLLDYSPEVPVELLQSLILPFKDHMERLSKVEQYLKHREDNAKIDSPSIFHCFGDPATFSARYFDQSSEHQTLLHTIEDWASSKRKEKHRELSRKKEKYRELMRLHDQSECENEYVLLNSFHHFWGWRHSRECKKCGYKDEAASISIEVHEWPLPSDQTEAKSTVFELRVPAAFGQWRDATIFLIIDILGSRYLGNSDLHKKYKPQDYPGLAALIGNDYCTHRIGLTSQTKPHTGTHRRDKSIVNTTESEVCLKNGLRCQYHDDEKDTFVTAFCPTERIQELCTYKLPKRSSPLQKFLVRPPSMPSGLPPNQVISRQSDCPIDLSLDEFKAFSAVPLGYRIQWMNILTQLSVPSLDFLKAETSILLLQTIYQAGLPGERNVERASHEILTDETFGHTFLIRLRDALNRLKENWEAAQALASFIHLAARLLSLASSTKIQQGCLEYLKIARDVTFGWVNCLGKKADYSTEDTERIEFMLKALDLALICAATFDVDRKYLDAILTSSSEAPIFIQCSIVIQESSRSMLGQRDPLRPIMLERWKNLSYRAFTILTREVHERGSSCLNNAIKHSWPDYEAGCAWQPEATPYEHWLSSKTGSQHGSELLPVHYNLLTAELLVNGIPLTRLPSQYENHPMYTQLFGRSTIKVVPAKVRGMTFSAKTPYAGYAIHFGMQSNGGRCRLSESDLLLHARHDGQQYDLLPSWIFRDRFPFSFVDGCAHWYDHSSNSIEFRPIKDPWSSSLANWRLTKIGTSWRLMRDSVALVNVLSSTARALTNILSALEKDLHIHISFVESSELLDIELPRLQLSFYLKSDASEIHSRQFRGMSIDCNQGINTLIGLQNKLILKQGKADHDRLMVIPEGPITSQKTPDHIVVRINRNNASKAHVYHVDDRLGRVVDNGNLQSKLFLCHLHAVTSYCLPDRLTQRTGTEQALLILNSAAVRSFNCLTKENLEILERIAQLAPGRTYYPATERVMQSVIWDSNLSSLSQHGRFYTSVKAIFAQADEGRMFYSDEYIEPPQLDFTDPHLVERDLIRSSTFRVSDFGAECHTVHHDANYSSRDNSQNSNRATRSFVTASLIYRRQAALHDNTLSECRDFLWEHLKNCDVVQGPNSTVENPLLGFDSMWLEDPSTFLGPWWCSIHSSLGNPLHQFNNFDIMMWLSTMAFAKNADMKLIHTFAAFYNVPDVGNINVPPVAQFHLSQGIKVNYLELEGLVQYACHPFYSCPETHLPKHYYENENEARQRRQLIFKSNQNESIRDFIEALELQWPCGTPHTPCGDTFSTYINCGEAMEEIRQRFKTWFDNYRFHEYLGQIETILGCQIADPISTPSYIFSVPKPVIQMKARYVSVDEIFAGPAPSVFSEAPINLVKARAECEETQKSTRLDNLLTSIEAEVNTNHERAYIKDLRDSLLSLQGREKKTTPDLQGDMMQLLELYQADCTRYVQDMYSTMRNFVSGKSQISHSVAATVCQWPRVSPTLFLQQLTGTLWKALPIAWKKCIINYGLALTELQRAERLVRLAGNHVDLSEELLNIGHQNWEPFQFPESLLLEVESGIMIREVQEEIASQMRNPPSNKNAVMQLNMGEGKSSVIVPTVAITLADGTRLVRVVVGKPQSKQMFQMLVSKLGGLLGRRIYHMPFSRALRLGESQADAIGKIYRDCMLNRGILLVQPEHILSFKLMGLECLMTGYESVGQSLLNTQHFFDTKSRDIVDESDENFSVKFELIYTMGMQRPIEFSPERWNIIRLVLDLVARFALEVKRDTPLSIEVDDRWPGRFPRTRFLRSEAHDMVLNRVARHICSTGFPGFPVARQSDKVRQAIFKYITKPDLTNEEIAQVENKDIGSFWNDSTRHPLLLIRGLLAGGVLSFAFGSKRWRVNYGLDPNRLPKTKLALPFREKDNPTPRSEFSHPDVLIVLTSLSYYYGGLDDEDLFNAFSHLLKSDQAEIEYQEWVQGAPALPDSFRQLVGINIKDRSQCVEKVFPSLQYSKGAIDYFLSHLVYPKEIKEFPDKISASGWDIGQTKTYPTTGFSGTNDSRHVLPLSVEHLDLEKQKHTNALVLEYLLQDENSVELLPRRNESTRSDAELLLSLVTKMDPPTRVILDVGAQILELSNVQVAQEWLNMSNDYEETMAVVYFNDSDELSVLDRKGRTELLQTSPFAKQLDVCLVFLDEAHTRGTDLRLPKDYRAAVTLGANLTKDRLVQACMRMRKLGKGQSVVFCVPEEIRTKILELTPKRGDATIEVADVLRWTISETCMELQRSMPLWAAQGWRFEEQSHLWAEARTENGFNFSKSQAEEFLEEEAQTICTRYRPHSASEVHQPSGWDMKNSNICRIIERCREFESLNFNSATLQEEQERELSPEIEKERQVERPAPAEPETHSIHQDLDTFVKTGVFLEHSKAFLPAFEALRSSSAAAEFDVSQFPPDLFVTADFDRTVKTSGRSYVSDAYQRPVQWILTSCGAGRSSIVKHMVIISPYEAQELLPSIKECQRVTLHLYAPRPNLGFGSLDRLDLFTQGRLFHPCSISRSLIVQLNLFSGQLYLSSFQEYTEVCDFLGLAWKPTEDGVVVGADGFIIKGPQKMWIKDSPVKFLKVLMTKIRRNCEGIEKTHLGRILHGGLLEESEFNV